MDVDLGHIVGTEQRRPEVALFAGLGDCAFEDRRLLGVLATDVDIGGRPANHPEVDQHALDQHVRVAQDDLAVLKGPGLRLVAIDDEVALGPTGEERGLLAGGEACATTTAQVRGDHLVDQLLARHADGFA